MRHEFDVFTAVQRAYVARRRLRERSVDDRGARMGYLSPFFVKPFILQGDDNAGECFPMLMHRATHLPATRVIEWALLSRRRLVASNTLGRYIREVGHFEHWMHTKEPSLDDEPRDSLGAAKW